jgi:hypothetical protein
LSAAAHHMTKVKPGSCKTPIRMRLFCFLLAPSHHHLHMNLCYTFLLLLLVLLGFSESLQHVKPPDFLHTRVTVCSSVQLGVLAPVQPQNEVYRITPPHNEVYKTTPPHTEIYKLTSPHNEVYKIIFASE